MKKNILFLSLLALAVSCGGGKGGGTTGSSGSSASGVEENKAPECAVAFDKRDTLKEVALKSNLARTECKLSEEQIVKMVEEAK